MKNYVRQMICVIYCYLNVWILVYSDGHSLSAAETSANRITKSNNAVENRTPPNPGFSVLSSNAGSGYADMRIGKSSTGVELSWQPVTMDVNGQAEELAGYEILRANTAYFNPGYDLLLATSSLVNFNDEAIPDGTDEVPGFFYLIRARDWWGNVSLPSNRVGTIVLPLQSGWNLIAVPLDLNDFALAAALGNQMDGADTPEQSTMICSFDASQQQFRVSWLQTIQTKWHGNVSRLERGQGYFIKLPQNDPVALDLIGYVPEAPISVKIRPGWNLVGNPMPATVTLRQSGLIESGFAGASRAADSDQIFQLQGNGYRQAWYNSATQSWEGDFDQLTIGTGYWIYRQVNRGSFDWLCPIPEAK